MNTQTQEALKMAKDMLLELNGHKIVTHNGHIVIDTSKQLKSCKEALESQEQEPVAIYEGKWEQGKFGSITVYKDIPIGTDLYTHPAPAREPLSDDELDKLRRTNLINVDVGYSAGLQFARLIEKAHGIGEQDEQALKEKNSV